MIRILHFSDIHVALGIKNIEYKELFNKRSIGALNLTLRRAKYFNDIKQKIDALISFKEQNSIDIIINTGDYTALGLKGELELAKKWIAPLINPPDKYLTVAGNHDIYVDTEKSYKNFFKKFGSILQSDMPEYAYNIYPIVRLIGENCAVIMINSAKANLAPWDSSGKIPQKELEALKQIIKDKRVKNRFIFVGTHYAPRLANGENDTLLHGLVNSDEFLNICREIHFGAILCGHIHRGYRVSIDNLNSEIFCAGSLTMQGREGFWLYELENNKLKAFRKKWQNNKWNL